MYKTSSLLVVFVSVLYGQVAVYGWTYDDETAEGPSHWPDAYPTCGSTSQSPVNIITNGIRPLPGSGFTFTNYGRTSGSPFTLVNNGHSAMVKVNIKDITITKGALPSTYTLEQFHIHWGADASAGSEHTVDSFSHPMEIHFVHYNSALYPDVATAAASGDSSALAVLGVFVDINENSPTVELNNIADQLNSVLYEGDSTFINYFDLSKLIPTIPTSFFRYNGSLTTPGCNEVVVWSVFVNPRYITSAKLDAFRQLHHNLIGEPDEFMTHNYRPVQPLNGRQVFREY